MAKNADAGSTGEHLTDLIVGVGGIDDRLDRLMGRLDEERYWRRLMLRIGLLFAVICVILSGFGVWIGLTVRSGQQASSANRQRLIECTTPDVTLNGKVVERHECWEQAQAQTARALATAKDDTAEVIGDAVVCIYEQRPDVAACIAEKRGQPSP